MFITRAGAAAPTPARHVVRRFRGAHIDQIERARGLALNIGN